MKTFSSADPSAVSEAVSLLRAGKVLLVPTETVYGLVCDYFNPEARAEIYAMKHRSENKPLAAFVPDVSAAEKIAGRPLPETAKRFASAFMPGPITIIVGDSSGSTFGFRIPDHPYILSLLKAYQGALASTSANLSGQPAALDVPSALASIAAPPALAVDAGPCAAGSRASSVVQIHEDGRFTILRPGPVTETMLTDLLR